MNGTFTSTQTCPKCESYWILLARIRRPRQTQGGARQGIRHCPICQPFEIDGRNAPVFGLFL